MLSSFIDGLLGGVRSLNSNEQQPQQLLLSFICKYAKAPPNVLNMLNTKAEIAT